MNDKAKEELLSLTGLRGIAAIWVLLFHYYKLPGGYLGVDVFFVLSGFVLAHNYSQGYNSWGYFLWKRIARIYPLHVVSLALTVVIVLGAGNFYPRLLSDERFESAGILTSLALVHAWNPPVTQIWNIVSWSISCEWAASLCFPIVVRYASRIRPVSISLLLIAAMFLWLNIIIIKHQYTGQMAYGMHRILVEFPSGVMLYRLYAQRPVLPYLGPTALSLLIVGSIWLELLLGEYQTLAYLPLLACLVVLGMASSKVLSAPILNYLGRISFALYLFHWPVLLLGRSMEHAFDLNHQVVSAVGLVASFLAAAAAYQWIERPAHKWLLSLPARLRPGRVNPAST